MATASAKSKITYIDGPKGILLYRGYPIEELAEKSNFMEVSYLLMYGELPSKQQYELFCHKIMKHSFIHEDIAKIIKAFRYDAHPMGMLITALAAMSTNHPEANPALAGDSTHHTHNTNNQYTFFFFFEFSFHAHMHECFSKKKIKIKIKKQKQ